MSKKPSSGGIDGHIRHAAGRFPGRFPGRFGRSLRRVIRRLQTRKRRFSRIWELQGKDSSAPAGDCRAETAGGNCSMLKR